MTRTQKAWNVIIGCVLMTLAVMFAGCSGSIITNIPERENPISESAEAKRQQAIADMEKEEQLLAAIDALQKMEEAKRGPGSAPFIRPEGPVAQEQPKPDEKKPMTWMEARIKFAKLLGRELPGNNLYLADAMTDDKPAPEAGKPMAEAPKPEAVKTTAKADESKPAVEKPTWAPTETGPGTIHNGDNYITVITDPIIINGVVRETETREPCANSGVTWESLTKGMDLRPGSWRRETERVACVPDYGVAEIREPAYCGNELGVAVRYVPVSTYQPIGDAYVTPTHTAGGHPAQMTRSVYGRSVPDYGGVWNGSSGHSNFFGVQASAGIVLDTSPTYGYYGPYYGNYSSDCNQSRRHHGRSRDFRVSQWKRAVR